MAMSQGVAHVDSKTFQDVVERSPVEVVDFYADWCGPCKIVAPIMEKLAEEYNGKARFTKVDVDDNPALADQFGIMSLPILIISKNGKPVERIVGTVRAEHCRGIIGRVL